jgi:hypothetical protein
MNLIRTDLKLRGCEPYSCGSGQGPVTGLCESGNEHSGSIKAENYLTSL